jgi:hypothetical protein
MPKVKTSSPRKSLYSLHPAYAMEAAYHANLKERTGKTIDEWVDFVKKSGPPTEKARRAWLKEQGLTTNYAWWVAEAAEGKGHGSESYDPETYVEAMFANKPNLRPVYDELLRLGLGLGEDVKACPCETIVPLYRKHVFAQIKPTTRTRIVLGLALRDTPPTGRLIDTGGLQKKDRITHRITITSPDEIDDEVKRWLRTAYEMASDEAESARKSKKKSEPITVPDDFAQALARQPPAKTAFDKLPPSHRREYVESVVEAKKPETRARRIAKAVETLAKGK